MSKNSLKLQIHVLDYVANSTARNNASFIKGMYILNGVKYTPDEFNVKFPIKGEIRFGDAKFIKGGSPDSRTNWMYK